MTQALNAFAHQEPPHAAARARESVRAELISFAIGEEQYGVDIMAVREIKGWSEINHLPGQPDYVRGVLNLRPLAEQPGRDEAAEVAAAGLAYASLPIADAGALDRESAAALDRALRKLPTPLLVHCASGNRVGALVALREAWFAGADPQTALTRGRAAGLAGLEPQIRRQLGLPDPTA